MLITLNLLALTLAFGINKLITPESKVAEAYQELKEKLPLLDSLEGEAKEKLIIEVAKIAGIYFGLIVIFKMKK